MKIVAERCSHSVIGLLPRFWNPQWVQQTRRMIGTSTVAVPPGLRDDHRKLLKVLSASSKMIPVKGDHVSLLDTPRDFYEALKEGIRNSRTRVVMASLYIGTGKLESELVGRSTLVLRAEPVPKKCNS